jgi:uncharacterized protein (TIGR02145 family)
MNKFNFFLCLFCVRFLISCSPTSPVTDTIPAPPINLEARLISGTQIDLNWTDVSTNEQGFKIERKVQNGQWGLVGTVGENISTFSSTNLTVNTTYVFRVYSFNTAGNSTIYTNEVTITTRSVPSVQTTNIASVTSTSVLMTGEVLNDWTFPVSQRGFCISTSPNPIFTPTNSYPSGSGVGSFSKSVSGLLMNTTYYLKAYAVSSIGTGYGNEITFTTLAELPSVNTVTVDSILMNSCVIGGEVISTGGATTTRGFVWSTSINPTVALPTKTVNGSGAGAFRGLITNLQPATTYYVRAYATNSVGTSYGSQYSFQTALPAVTDIDGNSYETVQICNKTWTAKNLTVTKYRNGDIIPQVTDPAQWAQLTTGAWCYYNNDPTNEAKYGKLYNWYAVNDSRGIAPSGWHIPSDAEWATLETCLGGSSIAGSKIKSLSPLWSQGNNATNSSGFSAMPGGARYNTSGSFNDASGISYFWSSTLGGAGYAMHANTSTSVLFLIRTTKSLQDGISIRIVKD